MKAYELLFCCKQIKITEILIFIVLCGIRLFLPTTNYVFIEFMFTMIIFLVLPIALWWYLQKTTALFASDYARIRLQNKKIGSYFINILVNDLVTIQFIIKVAFVIFILSFDFSGFSFLKFYLSITLYWICIYLLFIFVFHFIFYISHELKTAFFSSYAFLFILSFMTDVLTSHLFSFEMIQYHELYKNILFSFILIMIGHGILYVLSIGRCNSYD